VIVEIGHFALVLALVMAVLQTAAPGLARLSGDTRLLDTTKPAAVSQLAMLLIAPVFEKGATSRDVYLPAGIRPLVGEGQTALAGETVFADLTQSESARHFRQE